MCSKTKKIILSAIIIAALQLLIFSGTSFSAIADSVHNLSVSGPGPLKAALGSEDEICIFCHTPHGAIVVDANSNRLPLWNRSIAGIDAATFTLYSSSTFNAGVLETNAQRQPQGMSLLCLSCHDGVSAINVLQNYGQYNPIVMEFGYDQLSDPPGPQPGNLGMDLSDDHPISFEYNNTLVSADNGGLKDPGSISPLRLFNNRLECATCHNPHEQGNAVDGTEPFLRMTNLNSDMCVKCHNK
ncbi:MAG: hypothetical protein WC855_09645 [Thermodesulfovibrionales bacterium]